MFNIYVYVLDTLADWELGLYQWTMFR